MPVIPEGDKVPDGFGIAKEFARISRELAAEPAQRPTLERIVELAVETIEPCEACGVSVLRPDGSIDTPACTSPLVEKADALQYEFGEGPCIEAIWSLDTYLIDDAARDHRWPRWSPAAAALGVGSVLSLRLDTSAGVTAGLNLYASRAHAYDNTDVAAASIFARHAADALDAAYRVEGLSTALRTRQSIGVAQGMLMQRYGLTLDQSFEVLRRYSQNQNIKLRELAEQLVRSGPIAADLTDPFEAPPESSIDRR